MIESSRSAKKPGPSFSGGWICGNNFWTKAEACGLSEKSLKTRLILQVHDELVFEAPRDEIAPVQELVGAIMTSAYLLDPPLEVEFKVGENWADVE